MIWIRKSKIKDEIEKARLSEKKTADTYWMREMDLLKEKLDEEYTIKHAADQAHIASMERRVKSMQARIGRTQSAYLENCRTVNQSKDIAHQISSVINGLFQDIGGRFSEIKTIEDFVERLNQKIIDKEHEHRKSLRLPRRKN